MRADRPAPLLARLRPATRRGQRRRPGARPVQAPRVGAGRPRGGRRGVVTGVFFVGSQRAVSASGGLLVQGDAAHLARHVPPRSAQLVYLDPPFCVGTRFGARTKRGGWRADGPVAYEDRWPSLDTYLAWLGARLAVARECLAT